jgi:hypothetical protein
LDDCHQIFLLNGNTARFHCTLKTGIFSITRFSLLSIKSVFDLFITLERSQSIFRNNRICCFLVFPFSRKIWWQSSKTFQKINYVLVLWKYTFGVMCANNLQIQRKICFKVNTFFYRSLKKEIKKIFCTVLETVCASSLAMCAYRICELLHLTFSDHLNLYSQQTNANFRFSSEQIPLVSG